MIRRLLLPAVLLILAGCAGGESHEQQLRSLRPKPGGGELLKPVRLFISPSGEPFRGEDGLGAWIGQADTDRDGAISLAEFRADARHAFNLFDTNGDGVIDGFELQHYEHDLAPEIALLNFDAGPTAGRAPRRGGGGGRGRGGGGRPGGAGAQAAEAPQDTRVPGAGLEGAARYGLINEPEPIAAADADVDGKVTLAEWMAITDRRFAKLDRQKTGKLTRESLLHPGPKPKEPAKAP